MGWPNLLAKVLSLLHRGSTSIQNPTPGLESKSRDSIGDGYHVTDHMTPFGLCWKAGLLWHERSSVVQTHFDKKLASRGSSPFFLSIKFFFIRLSLVIFKHFSPIFSFSQDNPSAGRGCQFAASPIDMLSRTFIRRSTRDHTCLKQ